MSRRLTNAIKARILSNVLTETFAIRQDELHELALKAGDLMYDAIIPERYQQIMRSLPEEYFDSSDYVSCKMKLADSRSEFHQNFKMSESRPFPAVFRYNHGREETVYNIDLGKTLSAYYAKETALEDDRAKLTAKVSAVLATVNTDKQLLETWPEATDYIPYDMFPAPKQPLAITGSMINELVACSREGTCV